MIPKVPNKNTYKISYPEGLKEQIKAYHKHMKCFDYTLGELDEKKDLDATLDALRTDERKILMLHYKEHMSKKEIAESCGISYTKVCEDHRSGIIHLMKKLLRD